MRADDRHVCFARLRPLEAAIKKITLVWALNVLSAKITRASKCMVIRIVTKGSVNILDCVDINDQQQALQRDQI